MSNDISVCKERMWSPDNKVPLQRSYSGATPHHTIITGGGVAPVRRSLCEEEEEEEEEEEGEGVERCLVQFCSRVIIYSNLDIIL